MPDRRTFLTFCVSAGFSATVAESLWNQLEAAPLPAPGVTAPAVAITTEMVRAAEALAGLRYTEAQRSQMIEALENFLSAYEAIRMVEVPNEVLPAVRFSPTLPGRRHSGSTVASAPPARARGVRRPRSRVELAFMTVAELGELLRTKQVTSTELTRLYLERLQNYDDELHCVATLTEARAMRLAAQADQEIAAGKYRGPLHGIPYGVKDVFAVPGYPTTWGAAMYRERVINDSATVVQRLDAAGAVLVAKLAMGELGLSDVWYGGQTKNPWRLERGATGSSSGSAVATAAGLVGFAIGMETMGSIVGPASRNGVSALRPTFGRVSRAGAMNLSWSLDKVGPMARSAEDCALILQAIHGPDGKDPTVVSAPYAWDPERPLSSVRVGYFKAAFDAPRPTKALDDMALSELAELGVRFSEVELPTDIPINSLLIVRVEAAAALDDVARDGGLGLLKEQGRTGWPNFIRASRLVPAVEYIQAQRIRTMLMERMEQVFERVDVFVAPTFGVMPLTNLTGHPALVVPNGFTEDGMPTSISFIGKLYGEAELCAVARAWQEATGWHHRHPAPFSEQN